MRESLSGRLLRSAATSKRRRRLTSTVLHAAGPILPRRPRPAHPVFILGSPRSGTTLLFEVLNRSPAVASLEAESHLLWEMFHTLRDADWRSHEVAPSAIGDTERRVVYWAVDRVAGGRRYLDKAPRNCLRVPYLHALFPDAWFVHLKRDGRAAVSSLITGWRAPGGMFPGTRMPVPLSIEGYDGDTWKFIVPQGWEAYATGRSLEEVCAFQWISANQAILDASAGIGTDRWVEVRYEEFVDEPREQTARLMEALRLPFDPEVLAYAGTLDRHVTKAVTPPRADKWRRENPREIERVMPLIEPMMRRLGYEVQEESPA
jgi:Sulfotransferase family